MLRNALALHLLFAATVAIAQGPSRVEIFTTGDRPVSVASGTGIAITVYQVDAVEKTRQALGANLPKNADAARALVLQRIQGMPGIIGQLAPAAAGLATAFGYGLDRYPAIVFDGKAVVYGETDLESAVALYDRVVKRQWDQTQ